MKKIFTLIAVAALAINVQAENKVVQWKASDGGQAGGETLRVRDAERNTVGTLAFGTTDNWTTAEAAVTVNYGGNEYAFDTYFTTSGTNGNGGADLAADGSSPYNYMAFTPNHDGTLVVVVHNGGTNSDTKYFWCYENGELHGGKVIGDGTLNLDYNGQQDLKIMNDGQAVNGGVQIPVSAGKLYTFSVNGSKSRWMGIIYDYDPASTAGIQNVSAQKANAAAYNLAGQKVNDSFKGVVIKNGKKIVK